MAGHGLKPQIVENPSEILFCGVGGLGYTGIGPDLHGTTGFSFGSCVCIQKSALNHPYTSPQPKNESNFHILI